ncbi:maleylacetoacetate isomerase [Myriangium duriaei CBS 260.36]|uniref:Maleylacetoacetate isomerase n=1 Tax=Myriangium duriaei CBS 260.36 TaxID=1168546 RepID=A0A9P4MRF4_9PEZI|nr:maleylacetoacetate isomerase [Myriangium duriaei CBS 260.36]
MADTQAPDSLVLYSYFRSSCSARVRIALEHKSIQHQTVFVNIKDGVHQHESYVKVNPSVTVPTLLVPGSQPWSITQSVAALEYLEEAFPETPCLLPPASDSRGRALVRTLVNIVACDIQPVTNMKVLKQVGTMGGDTNQWIHKYAAQGFAAYERLISQIAGSYSYGDAFSLADVCLAPAVWNAERYEMDMTPYPTVMRVYKAVSDMPAVRKAHWQQQPDCPAELRS